MYIHEEFVLTQSTTVKTYIGLGFSRDETVSDNGRNEKRIRRPISNFAKMYLRLRHHRN